MNVEEKYNNLLENLDNIQKDLDYKFGNDKLLIQAFCRDEVMKPLKEVDSSLPQGSNVLEFIGDRALYSIIAKEMSNKSSTIANGFFNSREVKWWSNTMVELSCNATFKKLIENWRLSDYLVFRSKGLSRKDKDKMHADLFEAIIGAVAIDSNWSQEEMEHVYDRLSGKVKGHGLLRYINSMN